MTRKIAKGKFIMVFGVLVFGLMFSFILFFTVRNQERQVFYNEFVERSRDRVELLKISIDDHIATLNAMYGFFVSSIEVDREEFFRFVNQLNPVHPNVLSFDWLPRVTAEERVKFEENAQKEGFTDFRITEEEADGKIVAAAEREEYYPLFYMVPFEPNKIRFGFDNNTGSVRPKAMQKAIDTGLPIITRGFVPPGEPKNILSTRVYRPVYKNELPRETIEERRENIVGFISVLFRIGETFEKTILNFSPLGIDVYLYDVTPGEDRQLLYLHTDRLGGYSGKENNDPYNEEFTWSAKVDIAGRLWEITAKTTPLFFPKFPFWQSWIVLFFGISLTLILLIYLFEILGRTARIQALVNEKTLELKESEEKFRSLVQNANSIILRMDTKGNIDFFNEYAQKFFGFSEKEILGKNVMGTIVPKISTVGYDLTSLIENIAKHPNTYLSNENENITRDGRRVWVSWTNKAVYDRQGNLTGILSIGNDITDSKKAEEANLRLAALVSSSEDAIIGKDLDGVITSWNQGAQKVYGYSEQEALGRHVSILSPDRSKDEVEGIIEAIKQGKSVSRIETVRLKKDGTKVDISLSVSPVRDYSGKIIGASTIAHDITERKRHEELVRKEKEYIESLIQGIKEGVILLDKDGRQILTNDEFCKMTGFSKEELVNIYPPFNYWAQEDMSRIKDAFAKTLKGVEGEYELIFKKKDKSSFFVLLSARRIFDPDGNEIFTATIKDITERKIAAEKIENSLKFYLKLLDEFAVAVWQTGLDAKCNYFNKAWLGFTGRSLDQELGDGWIEGVHAEDLNSYVKTYLDAFGMRQPFSMEHRLRRFDGEYRWVINVGRPFSDNEGNFAGFIGSIYDITEIKNAQQALLHAKNKAELLYKVVPSGIYTVDLDRRITSWNNKASEITGYSAEEVIGKECGLFADLPCKDSCELFLPAKPKAIHDWECVIKRKDGSLRTISKNADILKDEFGTVIGGIESFEDVTERKKAEEGLRKLSTAVEQSPAITVITDKNGKIQYVNPKFTEITGYLREEIINKNPNVLKSGEVPTEDYRRLWQDISSGREWRGEFHNKKKNGELYWEQASISSVKNYKGEIEFFIKVAEDVTQRKRIEKELLESSRLTRDILSKAPFGIYVVNESGKVDYVNSAMLEISGTSFEQFMGLDVFDLPTYKRLGLTEKIKKALDGEYFTMEGVEYSSYYTQKTTIRNFYGMPLFESGKKKALVFVEDITERKRLEKLKDEFVSNVSHELRTPLSIIKEGVSLVLDEIVGEINKKQRTVLGTSKDNIDRLGRIINDLLDIAKIESGKLTLHKDNIDLVALVRRISQSYEIKIREKDLELKMNFSGEEIFAYVDEDRITQIFMNLINNAIKFTSKGYILLSVIDKDNEIECSVEDTGRGITDEDVPKLFSKFEQFGRIPAGGIDKGTGLGLSIAKALVVSHNGNIRVESKIDSGTKFIFVLPKKVV